MLKFVVIGIEIGCIFAIKYGTGPIRVLNLRSLLLIKGTATVPDAINVKHSNCHSFYSVYATLRLGKPIAAHFQNPLSRVASLHLGKSWDRPTDPKYHLF